MSRPKPDVAIPFVDADDIAEPVVKALLDNTLNGGNKKCVLDSLLASWRKLRSAALRHP